MALIAANIAVFIASMAMGDSFDGEASAGGLMIDAATWGAAIDAWGEWWRVFTGGFMHHGVFHLAVNMFSLYYLGLAMERWVGRVPFAAVYFASLVAGSFGALIEAPNALVAGASGAIFGLMGAFVALCLAQGVGLFQTPIGPILAVNLVISFTVPGISLGGHLGGDSSAASWWGWRRDRPSADSGTPPRSPCWWPGRWPRLPLPARYGPLPAGRKRSKRDLRP